MERRTGYLSFDWQENAWWSGIICIIFMGLLNTDYFIKIFDHQIGNAKIVVLCAMGGCFFISAKKTLLMLAKVAKSASNIKSGKEPDADLDEEN